MTSPMCWSRNIILLQDSIVWQGRADSLPRTLKTLGKNVHYSGILDKARRGEPHPCTTSGCKKQARHSGSLCEEHYSASVVDKDKLPLHEGCPLFLPVYNRNRIRWVAVHPEIAMWIEENLEQPKDGKRDTALLEILIIVGWKGARGGLFEERKLDGIALIPYC